MARMPYPPIGLWLRGYGRMPYPPIITHKPSSRWSAVVLCRP